MVLSLPVTFNILVSYCVVELVSFAGIPAHAVPRLTCRCMCSHGHDRTVTTCNEGCCPWRLDAPILLCTTSMATPIDIVTMLSLITYNPMQAGSATASALCQSWHGTTVATIPERFRCRLLARVLTKSFRHGFSGLFESYVGLCIEVLLQFV